MKRRILSILLTICLIVSVLPTTAVAEGENEAQDAVTFTAIEGTHGMQPWLDYDNVIDGKKTTDNPSKWSVQPFDLTDGAYVIIRASEVIKVEKYILTTADTGFGLESNPYEWELYGCNDYEASSTASWTRIDYENKVTLPRDNGVYYCDTEFTCDATGWYQYYMLKIKRYNGYSYPDYYSRMELGEISFTYTTCEHSWTPTGSEDTVAATCTHPEFKKMQCSGSCGQTVYMATGNNWLGHTQADADHKCTRCSELLETGPFIISGGAPGLDYQYEEKEPDTGNSILTILTDKKLTIQNKDPDQTITNHVIEIKKDIDADVTLNGLDLDASADKDSCAFKIEDNSSGDVTVRLAAGTTNKLTSGYNCAGLQKNGSGTGIGTLLITGSGSLTAESVIDSSYSLAGGGTGIGGGKAGDGSNIIISGVSVTALGSQKGAGIGGGIDKSGSNIKIVNSTVQATSRLHGAGIGGGYYSLYSGNNGGHGTDITIENSTVMASSIDSGAGIGGGSGSMYGGDGKSIHIIDSVVTAIGGGTKGSSAGIGSGCGYSQKAGEASDIVISGGSVKVVKGGYSRNAIGSGNTSKFGKDTDEALVPLNGKGEKVYPITFENPEDKEIWVDGAKYVPCNHAALEDNTLYAYFTGECHVIQMDGKKGHTHLNGTDLELTWCGTKYTSDENGHWYGYDCCGAKEAGTESSHTFQNGTCSDCGYDRLYTVEYDTDGGTDVSSASVTWKDKVLGDSVNPLKAGFRLIGWKYNDINVNYDTICGVLVGNGDISKIRLRALWKDVYKATVIKGSGSDEYFEGDIVTITADAAEPGKKFSKWIAGNGVVLADEKSQTTTFTMPATDVSITAVYKDLLPGKVVVNGIDLVNDDEDHKIDCGRGTAEYDPDTKTLTLDNAEITIHSGHENNRSGISISEFGTDDFTIRLIGNNSIRITDQMVYDESLQANNSGIMKRCYSKLSIVDGGKNDGSLDIVTFNNHKPTGIANEGDISIGNVKLSFSLIDGSSASCGRIVDAYDYEGADPDSLANPEWKQDYDIILDGTTITSDGGYYMGLYTCGDGAITLKNEADVKIKTYNTSLYGEKEVSLSDSKVNVSVQDKTDDKAASIISNQITIRNQSDVMASSVYGNGIYSNGNMSIQKSSVKVVSVENDAMRTYRGISVSDKSVVDATGGNYGIYTNGSLVIDSSRVAAKSTNAVAMDAIRVGIRSDNESDSRPEDSTEGILLGGHLADASGAAVKSEDWIYGNYWDDVKGSEQPAWNAYSYFQMQDGNPVSSVNIVTVYTVEFDSDGGESVADRTDVKWNDKVLENVTAPEYLTEGYEFAGWKYGNKAVDENTCYCDLAENENAMDIKLKAQWKDILAPVGEIRIEGNRWNKFLNTITFGLFFKDTQTVTVTASDNSNSAVKIEYLLSQEKYSKAELELMKFEKEYIEAFTINPDKKCIIYVKITDNSDNVSYICSDGLVLDATVPVVEGIKDKEIYCGARTVTVTEPNLDSVTLNGNSIKLDENGSFTIKPDTEKQQVIVTDKAGNDTKMTVTVNDGHTYEWKNSDNRYWKRCSICGEETDGQNIPDITINGAEKVCKTQDYVFGFPIPEGVNKTSAHVEAGGRSTDVTLQTGDGICTGTALCSWYDSHETFDVVIEAETEDGYEYTKVKHVSVVKEHMFVDGMCTICKFNCQYIIEFDTDGGSDIPDRTNVKWTDSILAGIEEPTCLKEGYEFAGWICSGAAVDEMTRYCDAAENQDVLKITLLAQWRDIMAPTGEIKVGADVWNGFSGTFSEEKYYQEKQKVSITAADNSGQPVTIEYLIYSGKLDKSELEQKIFTKYVDTFCADSENKYLNP